MIDNAMAARGDQSPADWVKWCNRHLQDQLKEMQWRFAPVRVIPATPEAAGDENVVEVPFDRDGRYMIPIARHGPSISSRRGRFDFDALGPKRRRLSVKTESSPRASPEASSSAAAAPGAAPSQNAGGTSNSAAGSPGADVDEEDPSKLGPTSFDEP